MTKRIFRAITLVAAAVLMASFIVTLGVLSEYFGSVQKELLHDELGLAAAAVETDGTEYLERAKSSNYRLTWIEPDWSRTRMISVGTSLVISEITFSPVA